MTDITVRLANGSDRAALARLAELDSAAPPRGPALVAQSGSRLLAALPLGAGPALADPFEPTSEIVAVLRLRAAQLATDSRERRGAGRRLAAILRPRPPHVRSR